MRLRVMTFNLLHDGALGRVGPWVERLPMCADVIRSRAPDVAGLQEATETQLADLTRALPEYLILPGPPSDGGRPLLRRISPGEHCAILVRSGRVEALSESAFWISYTPKRAGSLLPGALLPRVAHRARLRLAEGAELAFTCVHADIIPWTWRPSARILKRHLDSGQDGGMQIVAGDFNVPPSSRTWRILLDGACPFVDAWLAAHQRIGPESTYHGGNGRGRWPGRIDRILLRPNVPVSAAETAFEHRGGLYPSDHFPLLADIDL